MQQGRVERNVGLYYKYRGDTNGMGENEVTVTSGHTHNEKEQRNRKEQSYIRWRLSQRSRTGRWMMLERDQRKRVMVFELQNCLQNVEQFSELSQVGIEV